MITLKLSAIAVVGAIAFLAAVTKAGAAESRGDFKSMWTWGGVIAFVVAMVVLSY